MDRQNHVIPLWLHYFIVAAITAVGVFVAIKVADQRATQKLADSVQENARDREKHTATILRRLERLEQKIEGVPDSTAAMYTR